MPFTLFLVGLFFCQVGLLFWAWRTNALLQEWNEATEDFVFQIRARIHAFWDSELDLENSTEETIEGVLGFFHELERAIIEDSPWAGEIEDIYGVTGLDENYEEVDDEEVEE